MRLKNFLIWSVTITATVGLVASLALGAPWDISLGFAALLVISALEHYAARRTNDKT